MAGNSAGRTDEKIPDLEHRALESLRFRRDVKLRARPWSLIAPRAGERGWGWKGVKGGGGGQRREERTRGVTSAHRSTSDQK